MVKLMVYLLTAFVGLILGSASVFLLVSSPVALSIGATEPVEINGWKSDWAYGTTRSNPYTRAIVARRGLFALPRAQSVYFIKMEDSGGERLTETCSYQLKVPATFPANWWSITLYDPTGYLPMNDGSALSVNKEEFGGGIDLSGQTVLVAQQKPEGYNGPFISSAEGGLFDLTLRLYEPTDQLIAAPEAALNPPSIDKLSCAGDGS